MLLLSTSIRTGDSTKRTFTTCGSFHRAEVHPHRHLQLVQPQHLRLRPHQHLQLLLLPDPRPRQDLGRRRGLAPRHPPGRDLVVAMTLCRRVRMRPRLDRARRLQQKSPNACAVRIFRRQSRHQSIGHNCRQCCCSGLGKRANAAIRDYESEIRNRVRLTTSVLQPLHIT